MTRSLLDIPPHERVAAIRRERNKRSIERDRETVARGGFRAFVPLAFPIVEQGVKYHGNWHIDAVADHLAAVSAGQIRKLAIHQPPGTMKSLTASVLWHPWEWIDRPDQRFFSVSYIPDLSLDHTRRSRDFILSEWYQDRWGDRYSLDRSCAAGEYENSAYGWRYSTGVQGGITGWHCDKLLGDDLINPKDLTPAGLTQAEHWWNHIRPTRYRDLPTAATVLIMQRLHYRDPGYYAKEQGFEVLCLPMRYEAKVSWARDPRKEEGDLLWPAKFPEAVVKEMEQTLGPLHTASQYQQRPTPAGGLVIKSTWLRRWVRPGGTPPPALLTGEPAAWCTLPSRFDRIIQSWDCAFKDIKSSDWVVGQVWGVKAADFFLLDRFRGQVNVLGTCEAILAMTRKWKRATAVLIEDKANGPAVMQILEKRVSGMVPVDPEGGKEARMQATATFYEAGNVYHPMPEYAPWIDSHEEELTIFPMGQYDDSADSASQALTWLHLNRSTLGGLAAGIEKAGGLDAFFDF